MAAKDPGEMRTQSTRKDSQFVAQWVSLLDVMYAIRPGRRHTPVIVLTLGEPTGGVKLVAMPSADGWTLLQQLARIYGVDGEPSGSKQPYIPKFPTPHCLHRARRGFEAQRVRGMLRDLKKAMPELGEFVEQQRDALATSITNACIDARAAKRIVARLERAVLIAIDTVRIDT